MTTSVTLTGTGVPHVSPGRAGPGVLVRHGDTALQFDAGRATVLRLAEAGCRPHQLDAVFLTHVHSDHVVDLADLVMTRWVESIVLPAGPLPIVAVDGLATTFASTMLEPYADDIAVRVEHVQPRGPEVLLQSFALPTAPTEVWRNETGDVVVEAVAVHHEPVREAVGYRVTTRDGVVVISGDTRVCDEIRELARGADVLVHEACRATTMAPMIAGTALATIFDYHADTVALGRLAAEAGVGHLLLTHLIPQPSTSAQEAGFVDDVRAGGYEGPLTVGTDLTTLHIGPRARVEGLVFRDARIDDLAQIVGMYADDELGRSREDASTPLVASYVRAFHAIDTDPRQRLVVVELNGDVVGTMQLSFIPHVVLQGGERAQIEAVRVSSDHRGSGIGNAMFRWAIEQARERGCRLVQLTTNATREDAQRFYTELGFRPSHVGMKLSLE